MTRIFSTTFGRSAVALTGALALAACGSSDDASEEAVADTVEIPADEAMAGVTAEPVVDENVAPAPAADTAAGEDDTDAADPEPTESDIARAETAGEAAAAAAADVAAIAAGAAAATEDTANDVAETSEVTE